MQPNIELRKLPVGLLCNVASTLETNEDWKKVMSKVPRDPRSEKFEPKYNYEHIKLIEDHAKTTNRKAADILFEEWGTSGRVRPTLQILKDVLKKAEIFKAADEVAMLLGEGPVTRPLKGPGARIDTGITAMLAQDNTNTFPDRTTAQMITESNQYDTPKSLGNKPTLQMKEPSDLIQLSNLTNESMNIPNFSVFEIKTNTSAIDWQTSLPNIDFNGRSGLDTDILKDENLIHFEYAELENITRNFAEKVIYDPDSTGGKLTGKVGSGGFGEVFVGYHSKYGHLAVKKSRNTIKIEQNPELAMQIFNSEVRFLSQFRHKNIVPIIGIAKDGPSLCLVCEYISGGSLQQKIEEKILTETQRLDIMIGVAEGLKYLHDSKNAPEVTASRDQDSDEPGSKKNNFLHGDVKSANILLTMDCVPKICDFGLAKQYTSTKIFSKVIGTSAYMSPEALIGTITQKLDIYSYGIVLLELLTGQNALIKKNNSDQINIKDFVEESCPMNDIRYVLDPFVPKWSKAKDIHALANKCLMKDRHKRPTAAEVCEILYKIKDDSTQVDGQAPVEEEMEE